MRDAGTELISASPHFDFHTWRGDRVVDGNGLENRRGETHRGFESLPLRQVSHVGTPGKPKA